MLINKSNVLNYVFEMEKLIYIMKRNYLHIEPSDRGPLEMMMHRPTDVTVSKRPQSLKYITQSWFTDKTCYLSYCATNNICAFFKGNGRCGRVGLGKGRYGH